MVHQSQRLALRFEAGHHLAGVHADLDNFESDAALDRFDLLSHINHAAAALADFLQQFVAADGSTGFFGYALKGVGVAGVRRLGHN
jgi:hypothetical protein